jgi:hypothetical protein
MASIFSLGNSRESFDLTTIDRSIFISRLILLNDMDDDEAIPLRTFTALAKGKEEDPFSRSPQSHSPSTRTNHLPMATSHPLLFRQPLTTQHYP